MYNNIKDAIIIFSPGDMTNEEIISTLHTIPSLNIDNLEINNNSETMLQNADIISKALADAKEVLSSDKPSYDSNINCDNNSTFKLCDSDSLKVIDFSIFPGQDLVSGISASINGTIIGDSCYYPEDPDADEFGNVNKYSGSEGYVFNLPNLLSESTSETVSEVVSEVARDSSFEKIVTINNTQLKIITTNITFNIINDQIIKTTETIEKLEYYNYYFKIKVTFQSTISDNTFDLLCTMGLIPNQTRLNEVIPEFINDTQYNNVFQIGPYYIDYNYNVTSFDIPVERILTLAKNTLIDAGVIANSNVIIQEVNDASKIAKELDECMVDDKTLSEQKQSIVDANQAINEMKKVQESVNNTLDSLNDLDIIYDKPESLNQSQELLSSNYPIMLLNEELNIAIYAIDNKLHLQLPPSMYSQEDPTIIEYEMDPSEIYFLHFKVKTGTYEITFISPNKKIYNVTGTNFDNIDLTLKAIGRDNECSFCGMKIYDIIFGNGRINNSIDLYKNSLLNYIPDTAQLFLNFDPNFITNTRIKNALVNNTDNIDTASSNISTSLYGKILTNNFCYALEGIMDNFYCKENLINTSFTISFWLKAKKDINNSNRHIIISDDIGKNYIYYDAINKNIVTSFTTDIGVSEYSLYYPFFETQWTLITLKHTLHEGFELRFQNLISTNHFSIFINNCTSVNFRLMSICAEYSYNQKTYINNFYGYIAQFSLYYYNISESIYKTLFEKQSLIVKGLMEDDTVVTEDSADSDIMSEEDNISDNEFQNIPGFYDGITSEELREILKK